MDGSNPERVVEVLREHHGQAICDDCLAQLAAIKNRVAVNPITSSLGLTSDFVREKRACSHCCETKYATQAVR
ncbi:MAG: hypothetical protein ACF8NJ_04295 [Phycisphaerales bacterium JB038]